MLKSIKIENFKCFDSIEVDGFSRFTLVGGKNNIGKSALLEAIYLGNNYSDPSLFLNLQIIRGVLKPELTQRAISSFYHHFDTTKDFCLSYYYDDSNLNDARLFRLSDAEDVLIESKKIDAVQMDDRHFVVNIFSKTEEGKNDNLLSHFSFHNNSSRFQSINVKNEIKVHLVAPTPNSTENIHILFSKIDEMNRVGDIVKTLGLLFPDIKDLSLSVNYGTEIVVDIGLPKKIPISFLGYGIKKLLILLILLNASDAEIILIDEIENGFHHSIIPDVVKVLVKAATDHNKQIVATTHSYEFVKKAVEGLKDEPNDAMSFIRLGKHEGRCFSVPIDKEKLEGIIDSDWEIR